MADANPTEVYLKNVRLSFPHLLEKHKATEDAKPKYSAEFLIDPNTKIGKENIKKVEAAYAEAEMKAFKKKGLRYKPDRCHYKDGDDCVGQASGEVYDGYAGMKVVKASSDTMPSLLSRARKPISPDNSPFYGGCYVEAIVRFYGTSKGGAPGLFATLEAVRFWDDGEHFGSAPVGADAFDADDDEGEDDDEGMLD